MFTNNNNNHNRDNGKLLKIPFSFLLALFECLNYNQRYRIPNTRRTHPWFSDLTKIEWLVDCLLKSPFIEYIYVDSIYVPFSKKTIKMERIDVLYTLLRQETRNFSDAIIESLKDCIENESNVFHNGYGRSFRRLIKKIDILLRNAPSKVGQEILKANDVFPDKDQATYTYELHRKETSAEKEAVRKIIYKCITSE